MANDRKRPDPRPELEKQLVEVEQTMNWRDFLPEAPKPSPRVLSLESAADTLARLPLPEQRMLIRTWIPELLEQLDQDARAALVEDLRAALRDAEKPADTEPRS